MEKRSDRSEGRREGGRRRRIPAALAPIWGWGAAGETECDAAVNGGARARVTPLVGCQEMGLLRHRPMRPDVQDNILHITTSLFFE
jgi:hypothetical protein